MCALCDTPCSTRWSVCGRVEAAHSLRHTAATIDVPASIPCLPTDSASVLYSCSTHIPQHIHLGYRLSTIDILSYTNTHTSTQRVSCPTTVLQYSGKQVF